MAYRPQTSHQRYEQYKRDLKAHRTEGTRRTAAAHAKAKPRERQRSFLQLFAAFIGLIRGHRRAVALSLATVTVASGLRLFPPAATGFVLDYVLVPGERPPPVALADLLGPTPDRRVLLAVVAVSLVVAAVLSIGIGTWGRYINTITTKRVQSRVRKRVFEHAVRLPLHRVYQLKSGGVASILREDAGAVAELLFSMLYNPWRAVIQLLGTLVILAVIDWRLLVGSLVIIPVAYLTHHAWISRIRPLWRDIRAARQQVDSHATEAFGGMRVVRGFGRQRTEAGRFIRNSHLMIRQELLAWCWSRTIDLAWSVLLPLASAVLLWYGGGRILQDAAAVTAGEMTAQQALTVGDLVMFLFYLALLLEPLATLAMSTT
ncbi:MAG: ABC transporter ATP-binding protein [Phycisphaerales bacterium]|nr:MAG: ABC transporter ATP-binding protein [Phycisphaerales bacterium]